MTSLALRIVRSAVLSRATRHRYGDHARQVADLHRPRGRGPHPVVVVLHGGYWQPPYTKLVMRPLCIDLVRRGFAAFNVGYRRLGRDGGGWPQTFEDVAAAIDTLAAPELREANLDLERVTLVGHSAGGLLALWAAGRDATRAGTPGAGPRVSARSGLAMAAVCDLARAGEPARDLLGGTPLDVPERWSQADPMRRIPLAVPVALVHPTRDETVPVAHSRAYVSAARAAGAEAALVETPGGHRAPIDPASEAWKVAAQLLSAWELRA
jgi:acetyl esterase/lipase